MCAARSDPKGEGRMNATVYVIQGAVEKGWACLHAADFAIPEDRGSVLLCDECSAAMEKGAEMIEASEEVAEIAELERLYQL
jgi:hypothetical protein